MVAPPTFIFERLTLSLQLLASRLGEACLEALGYSVLREGNILEMVGIKLSVEEACSGIRSSGGDHLHVRLVQLLLRRRQAHEDFDSGDGHTDRDSRQRGSHYRDRHRQPV